MYAVLNVADTGPLESLRMMLQAVGVDCFLPNGRLLGECQRIRLDNCLAISTLVDAWGYERPGELPPADLSDMDRSDVVFFDTKAHRNYTKIKSRWPNARVCWYRINGGEPEHVINQRGDMGDEVNPPCPVMTPNRWYDRTTVEDGYTTDEKGNKWVKRKVAPWLRTSYSFWPPYHQWEEIVSGIESKSRSDLADRPNHKWDDPVCLLHNAGSWGYGPLIPYCRDLGVRIYGKGSPDGLIPHRKALVYLRQALAMVHLKSSDAPGYALYEAIASGCPIVCPKRLVWRCAMEELFEEGETCVHFDRDRDLDLTAENILNLGPEVEAGLNLLRDPEENARIGVNARVRLEELMWNPKSPEDTRSLSDFLTKCYG